MTVYELIRTLAEFPGDALVGIDDADTSWSLHVLAVRATPHAHEAVVLIRGDYHHRIPGIPAGSPMTPPDAAAREAEVEKIASELHEQYLATARRLAWPIKAAIERPYADLSEPAKELDRVFARWHLERIAAAFREREEGVKQVTHDFAVREAQRYLVERDTALARVRALEEALPSSCACDVRLTTFEDFQSGELPPRHRAGCPAGPSR